MLAILLVGGCASLDQSGLRVGEAPRPELLANKDVDPAVRERIAHTLLRDADEDTLRAALTQQPGNVDAAIPLVRALLTQKHPDEALQLLDSVLLAAPGDLRALNAKGAVLDSEGRHREAQALYQRALATEPDNEMLRKNLNLSLALDGKAESGNASLQAPSDVAHALIHSK
ncbi:tetratricopeptide repeat protein [Bradyrhizobium sp. LA6.10]|uniref:tetratricopeptide repeat protein n=1 Tax=Bradyrhizobium sp. LA6.10 TaxID=3156318 RepID=UPI0033913555